MSLRCNDKRDDILRLKTLGIWVVGVIRRDGPSNGRLMRHPFGISAKRVKARLRRLEVGKAEAPACARSADKVPSLRLLGGNVLVGRTLTTNVAAHVLAGCPSAKYIREYLSNNPPRALSAASCFCGLLAFDRYLKSHFAVNFTINFLWE